MIDAEAEGRRAGESLWPAGASWVPEEVVVRWRQLLAQHPIADPVEADAARAAFLLAARNARRSALVPAEAAGRAALLERLRARNAERTAAAHAANDAAGVPRDPDAELVARRRRASLERRRAAREGGAP